MHFSAAHHLIFADDGNIIFGLTRDYAGIAAVALGQVDGHAPRVTGIGERLVKGIVFRRRFVVLVREIGILLVFRERGVAQKLAAFHVEVILRAGEGIAVAGRGHLAAGSGPECIGSAHYVRVETFVRARVSSALAAVAERKDHGVLGLAGKSPDCGGYFAVVQFNVDER